MRQGSEWSFHQHIIHYKYETLLTIPHHENKTHVHLYKFLWRSWLDYDTVMINLIGYTIHAEQLFWQNVLIMTAGEFLLHFRLPKEFQKPSALWTWDTHFELALAAVTCSCSLMKTCVPVLPTRLCWISRRRNFSTGISLLSTKNFW